MHESSFTTYASSLLASVLSLALACNQAFGQHLGDQSFNELAARDYEIYSRDASTDLFDGCMEARDIDEESTVRSSEDPCKAR